MFSINLNIARSLVCACAEQTLVHVSHRRKYRRRISTVFSTILHYLSQTSYFRYKMNKYSQEERIFLVKAYYKYGESQAEALRKWSTAFKNKEKPSTTTVTKLIDKFERTGSVLDDVEARKSKPKTSRTPELLERVKQVVQEEPSISTRRLSQRLNVSVTTAWKILNKDLKLHPYKIQVAQQLTPASVEKRLHFAQDVCEMIDNGEMDASKIIFSDEAHFWLDGYVNRQNYRIWGSEKPELVRTKPLHPQKLTVWCGMTANRIFGPYFIDTSITAAIFLKRNSCQKWSKTTFLIIISSKTELRLTLREKISNF